MKISKLSALVGASALSLMATLPLAMPASAQDATGTNPTVDQPIDAPVPDAEDFQEADDNFDWGWLGLLGLLGLAGLANKRNDEPVRYREPDVASRTGYRE
jgi:hypothetical protein